MGYVETNEIWLQKDSLFEKSMMVGMEYLLEIDVNRLVAPSYEVHDLPVPGGAIRYRGWERKGAGNWGATGETFTLAGHSLGHYLSAAAGFCKATGSVEMKEKLELAVNLLDELQQKTGSGYIGGCLETPFTKAFAGEKDWHVGYWVPWYGVHKIYQGLLETYLYTGNEVAKTVLLRFADWAVAGLKNLSHAQMQDMLGVEHGGMNEVFAKLYQITGNETYLNMAREFTHDLILDALAEEKDELTGKHANTQIPKSVGAAALYDCDTTQYEKYRKACENFYDYVVNARSYAIGGNSIAEHFEVPGAESLGIKTCESCNTYNMLRLTEYLFAWKQDAAYMDFFEKALYNHILGQQEPESGAKEYFISMLPGHHRIYEKKLESWWCCTGTGMENPARYTKAMLFAKEDSLFINLYMSGEFIWKEKGLRLSMETAYPLDGKVVVKVLSGEAKGVLQFRAPGWLKSEMKISSKYGQVQCEGKQYLAVEGNWQAGDEILVEMPMELSLYQSREESQVAFCYGPSVLGAAIDAIENHPEVAEYTENEVRLDTTALEVPYLLAKEELLQKIKAVQGEMAMFVLPGQFTSDHKDYILRPFYGIHHQFYCVYWNVNHSASEEEWLLNSVTTDRVEPDGQQDEIGHGLVENHSAQGSFSEDKRLVYYRQAMEQGSFSYKMSLHRDFNNYLYLKTAASQEKTGTEVYANGQLLTSISGCDAQEVEVMIPKSLTGDQLMVTITLKTTKDCIISCKLTELRILRSSVVKKQQ